MKVLLRHARIISPSSPLHGQVKDLLITAGIIEKIADHIKEDADILVQEDNLHVSIGWMDMFAHFCDPGFEHKETLESGTAAAAAGGFTDVMLLPNTEPVVSSKAQVEYILSKASALPVSIHPLASVTKNCNGTELAEMYDMHASGALAFSDGIKPVQNPGVLLKALQYVLNINGTIIQVPDDTSISKNGLVNEGIASTRLGLPGKPAIGEELMIARDIELLRYTGSKLHITGISTKKAVELVSAAKKQGLHLTCSVSPYHCWFSDEDLSGYDTNLKVNPPLRTTADVKALRDALNDGMIDGIASHHLPQHQDDKTCEFEYAKNGMAGLETVFGAINSFSSDTDKLITRMSENARKIFGLPVPSIAEGQKACLTLFDPACEYIYDVKKAKSASGNNAFNGKKLKGKVIGIINNGKTVINTK